MFIRLFISFEFHGAFRLWVIFVRLFVVILTHIVIHSIHLFDSFPDIHSLTVISFEIGRDPIIDYSVFPDIRCPD